MKFDEDCLDDYYYNKGKNIIDNDIKKYDTCYANFIK